MEDQNAIISSVVGAFGQVREDEEKKELHLQYQGGSSFGTQGQYRIIGSVPWTPISEHGETVPLSQGGVMQIRSMLGGVEAQQCIKITPETRTYAAFQFLWTQPNAPSVTIEVEERTIEFD